MLKNFITLLLYFFGTSMLIAQNTTDYEIATDRPSVSFSVATTPKNTLIVEAGYLQFNQENDFTKTTTFDPNLSLRYGINKRTELRLGEEFLANRIRPKGTDTLLKNSNFLPIFLA